MIKAVAGTRERPTVLLGLTRANLERLLTNQPMKVSLRQLHPDLPDVTVVLLGGEDEDSITEDLRAIGVRLPPVLSVFTCPRCGTVSHNPSDRREGYCGRCKDWTGSR